MGASVIPHFNSAGLKDGNSVLWVKNTHVILMESVIFTKITNHTATILSVDSIIHITDHITFSLNQAKYCIVMEYILLGEQNVKLDIIANNFSVVFYAANFDDKNSFLCLFQYEMWAMLPERIITSSPHNHKHNYSILLQDNIGDLVYNKRFSTSHCDWMEESYFMQSDPFEVNKKIIHYVNNSMAVKQNEPNFACYCTDDQHYNCSIDELGPVYPGQTYMLSILVKLNDDNNDLVRVHVDNDLKRACRSHSIKNHMISLVPDTCTKIEFKSILYKDGHSCKIFLGGTAIT